MEIDSVSEKKSNKQKAEVLQALVNGPLSSSISKLSGSSRVIPFNEDFHFYNNFEEFKTPVKEMSEKSKSMLKSIGFSKCPLGKPFPFPDDSDETQDWLVDLNDEIFERFDASVDEFQRVRNKEEEIGRKISSFDSESGFQLVCRRNKKGFLNDMEKDEGKNLSPLTSVKMASRDKKTTGAKPRIPFHIPTIRRPQDEFNILVNNFNQPFEHVWLERTEDGSRAVHPLEKLSVLDFVDRNISDVELLQPPATESSPFMLVEDVKQLKELANKLHNVNEFAVDLEHNQYRSFQGMTCLMQISTRTEDFVVDTLKLRVQVGPYLREVFKDPSKKKVMHGADRDILWLQRDFGIYVCNLFDTGQASRVLQLERNSLEFLLQHFCGVTANKEYQNADWRLRPLPDEMFRYAREDTHYLLHIFDLMKVRLVSASTSSENGEDLLLEVYKRSFAICMQLYEKELLTDTSYLYIYGLQDADLDSQQLAIVAGLCGWRDNLARSEDESTGYILPNKALLEIARQMPLTANKLRRLVKSKHPQVELRLGEVVGVIRNSVQNAYAFEDIAEQLKERAGMASKQHMEVVSDEFEAMPVSEDPTEMEAAPTQPEKVYGEVNNRVNGVGHEESSAKLREEVLGMRNSFGDDGDSKKEENNFASEHSKISLGTTNSGTGSEYLTKPVPEVTVKVLKKPNRAFGAMLGNTASKRKLDPNSKDKAETKVEQIKSSVTLPFHSFSGRNEQSKPLAGDNNKPLEIPISTDLVPEPAELIKLEEIISLESDVNNHMENGNSTGLESDAEDELMSLSELSTSFQKCFPSKTQTRNTRKVVGSQVSEDCIELKPFDYATARESNRFGEHHKQRKDTEENEQGLKSRPDSKERRKKPVMTRMPTEEEAKEFQQQGKRRQAFPQSGNRTATFR